MWFQDFAKNLDKRFDKQEEFNKEIKISLEKINIKVNNLSSRVNKLVKINNLKE
jgi:hypothetical protein